MNCDPSGYMSIGEMSATMEARESLDETHAVHNAWAIRMGKKILISLRIGTYIGISVSFVYFSAPLSRETAEARVMMGGDVWAVTEKDAVELCSVLGGVLRGPERGKGNGALSPLHYHSSFGKGHILYGFDIISMAAGTLKFNIGF